MYSLCQELENRFMRLPGELTKAALFTNTQRAAGVCICPSNQIGFSSNGYVCFRFFYFNYSSAEAPAEFCEWVGSGNVSSLLHLCTLPSVVVACWLVACLVRDSFLQEGERETRQWSRFTLNCVFRKISRIKPLKIIDV